MKTFSPLHPVGGREGQGESGPRRRRPGKGRPTTSLAIEKGYPRSQEASHQKSHLIRPRLIIPHAPGGQALFSAVPAS